MPTFGSLFAGIGGIDLGLERAGWTGRWQVEWDEYCTRVLAKHWPDIPRYGDITTVDWSGVEPVDLIAGGFPCQPFSVAGRRKGIEDDRWLWPAFARAIGALRPRYVLVENVPGLLAGHGMGSVLGGLAALGYDAEWDCIPAAAVGAPHLRYRVWIIAHRQGDAPRPDADLPGPHRTSLDIFRGFGLRHEQVGNPGSVGWPVADADGRRRQGGGLAQLGWLEGPRGSESDGRRAVREFDHFPDVADAPGGRRPRPGQSLDAGHSEASRQGQATQPLDGRLGRQWATEPDVGRVAHGVPARVDRLRSLGNAVVPQVVEVIGRRLMELV